MTTVNTSYGKLLPDFHGISRISPTAFNAWINKVYYIADSEGLEIPPRICEKPKKSKQILKKLVTYVKNLNSDIYSYVMQFFYRLENAIDINLDNYKHGFIQKEDKISKEMRDATERVVCLNDQPADEMITLSPYFAANKLIDEISGVELYIKQFLLDGLYLVIQTDVARWIACTADMRDNDFKVKLIAPLDVSKFDKQMIFNYLVYILLCKNTSK